MSEQPCLRDGPRNDWFEHSGFGEAEFLGLDSYTERLASYIADPSTVRVRVLEKFGQAPSIDVIRDMRARWQETSARRSRERISKYGKRTGGELDPEVEAAAWAPAPIPQPAPPPPPLQLLERQTPRDVVTACADAFGVTYADLIGSSRKRIHTRPRNLATAVLRARGNSYPSVGNHLGERDHSSVINGIKRFFAYDLHDEYVHAAWVHFSPLGAKCCLTLDDLDAFLAANKECVR